MRSRRFFFHWLAAGGGRDSPSFRWSSRRLQAWAASRSSPMLSAACNNSEDRNHFNSLTPERFGYDYKNVIFSLALQTGIFRSFYDNVIRWMPQDLTDDKSTLVQVMAWCRQATSYYLSQCWPRSMLTQIYADPDLCHHMHAGDSLRFLASDWLHNSSWVWGSIPGGSATVCLPLAITHTIESYWIPGQKKTKSKLQN